MPDLLDGSMDWLRRNLRSGVRVAPDGSNFDHQEFPLGALCELVANALVHRDLGPHTQSKRVEIRLRPDRLVISSPGGLWGVSRQQLGKPGGKSAVNEHLYDMCTLLTTSRGARVIEGEGGGIGEAQRALADWPVDLPIFVDKAVWILRSGRAGVPLCGEPVFRGALSHCDGPGWTVGRWEPTAGRPPTFGHSSWVKCLRMESSQLRTVACALVVIRSTMASARIFSSIRSCH